MRRLHLGFVALKTRDVFEFRNSLLERRVFAPSAGSLRDLAVIGEQLVKSHTNSSKSSDPLLLSSSVA